MQYIETVYIKWALKEKLQTNYSIKKKKKQSLLSIWKLKYSKKLTLQTTSWSSNTQHVQQHLTLDMKLTIDYNIRATYLCSRLMFFGVE